MPEGETYVDNITFKEFKEADNFGSVTISIDALRMRNPTTLTLESPVCSPMEIEPEAMAMPIVSVAQALRMQQDVGAGNKNNHFLIVLPRVHRQAQVMVMDARAVYEPFVETAKLRPRIRKRQDSI